MAFLDAAARVRLDLALYDVRLPGAAGDAVAGAVRAAAGRGVAVRIAFNAEEADERRPAFPPAATDGAGAPRHPRGAAARDPRGA